MRTILALLLSAACLMAGPRGSYDSLTAGYLTKVYQGSGVGIAPYEAGRISNLILAVYSGATWSNVRIYNQNFGQNAGTGSVVYTSGGWSPDNHNLIGSPTWGAGGINYNGTTQYGADPSDIWAGGTALSVFVDFAQDTLTLAQALVSSFGAVDQRSFLFQTPALGADYNFITNLNGNTTPSSQVSTFGTPATATQRSIFAVYSASSLVAYINGSSSTVTTNPTASLFNGTIPFCIGAQNQVVAASTFFDGKIACVIIIKQTLSTAAALRINAAMEALR